MMPLALLRRLVALYRGLPLLAQLGIPIAVALVAYIGVLRIQRDRARARADQLAVDKLNIQAAADVTHKLDSVKTAAVRAFLHDSVVQGFQRLVEQQDQQATQITKALGLVQRFGGTMELRFGALQKTITAGRVTSDTAGVRHAAIDTSLTSDSTHATYQIKAAVDLPAPPAFATWRLGISQPPARAHVFLGCQPKNEDGLHPVSFAMLINNGITVSLDSLTSSKDVCNAERDRAGGGWKLPAWLVAAAAGAGALAAKIF